jgi:hypothetical protein
VTRRRRVEQALDPCRPPGNLASAQIVVLVRQMVTALHDGEIEAKARVMLRKTIGRLGWYAAVRGPERKQLIDRYILRHWHLMSESSRVALFARQQPATG